MGLSSNTLLHQTDFYGLSGILKAKSFQLSYSLEEIRSTLDLHFKYAFPMVSFSDIPFSDLINHLNKYGGFSIGMKREWIIKKRFTPVCYYSNHSPLIENMIERFKFHQLQKNEISLLADNLDLNAYLYHLAHAKNYEGYLKTSKKEYKSYRFSDEREWRYVPKIEALQRLEQFFYLTEDEYNTKKKEYNDNILKFQLFFEVTDIQYIIVKEEYQVAKFKEYLKKMFKREIDKIGWNNININFFSCKQIENDFLGLSHDIKIEY